MSVFKCKQFEVHQDACAMKVGTDGMLLGAWAPISPQGQLLDAGTGTGIIALMLAQRCPQGSIHALEIEPAAQQQAQQNFAHSPWPDRLQLIAQALQDYQPDLCYDHLISNPPFYPHQAFSQASGKSRQWARTTTQLSHEQLLEAARRLLHPHNGQLSLILPTEIGLQFIQLAKQKGWHLWQRTGVCPAPGQPPGRLLLNFGLKAQPLTENQLFIRNNSKIYKDYHEDYRKLMQEFMIIF